MVGPEESGTADSSGAKNMVWRIHPFEDSIQCSEEIKAFAMRTALSEALKQTADLQDVSSNSVEHLGQKWQHHIAGLQQSLWRRHGEYVDDLLVLAWRTQRFANHYHATLIRKTSEISGREPTEIEKEIATAKGCERRFQCGVLVAQYYATLADNPEALQGTRLTKFPDTGEILEALSLDYFLHAALCRPNDTEQALDLLADAVSARQLAVQGTLHLGNFYGRKAEKVINGKAGAKKRHAKMAQLKEWTLEKYKAGSWKSANQAASELTSQVLTHSEEIGANLMKSNAQRTIAEWIRKSV
jgi:hypothetical protein